MANKWVNTDVPEEEHAALVKRAKRQGLDLRKFSRRLLHREAVKEMKQQGKTK